MLVVGGGAIIVAGGQAALVLAPVEAAFGLVTVPVGGVVDGGWPAAG
jgi:hypothetical protein